MQETTKEIIRSNPVLKPLHKTYLKSRRLYNLYRDDHDKSKDISLHDDNIMKAAFNIIVTDLKVTSIVETGTYLGFTTRYLGDIAERLSTKENFLQVYSSELDKRTYKKARKRLIHHSSIVLFNENSPDFITRLMGYEVLGKRPLFYLDAHWNNVNPLKRELNIIMNKLDKAIIVIDDFMIDGNPNFFYDTYNGVPLDLAMVIPHLDAHKKYNLLFPNYKAYEANHEHHIDLFGYPIIFQNMEKEFKQLKKNVWIKKYFDDRTDLLKPFDYKTF